MSITAPAADAEITTPGTLVISASASDDDGTVVSVEFFFNGASVGTDTTAPYSVSVEDPPAGSATLRAVARDDDGNTGTSPTRTVLVVSDNEAPVATLTAPEAGQKYASPGTITLAADVNDPDGTVASVEYQANGETVDVVEDAPFTGAWESPAAGDYAITATVTDGDGAQDTSSPVEVSVFTQGAFVVEETRLGDPDTCYGNPEFSRDGQYLVWFERRDETNEEGRTLVDIWHCGVDRDTGDLIPPDCRGFRAFTSTQLGRAYVGLDADGPLYLGADDDYFLTLVRPTGPTTGEVTTLPSLPDDERRGIYPSVLPNSDEIYAYWLKSIGGLTPASADRVELRVVNLDDPANEIVVSSQERPPFDVAPIDITFPRWAWDEPIITYGAPQIGPTGDVQVFTFDARQPDAAPGQVTADGTQRLIDPFPFLFNGRRFIAAGEYPSASAALYGEVAGDPDAPFELVERFEAPPAKTFEDACSAQSTEPFSAGGRLYTPLQVSSCDDDTNVLFTNTSEIWFTELLAGGPEPVRVTQGGTQVKIEPEPLVGTADAWVYYNRYPEGEDQNSACFQLYRANTPVN